MKRDTRNERITTYPTCLEDCHNYTDAGHSQDDYSVVVVIVGNPEEKAKQLEDVERIKDFEAK